MEKATVLFTTIPYEKKRLSIEAVVDERRKLQVLSVEDLDHPSLVGRIYLAKVVDLVPSIQAAFVRLEGNIKGYLSFDQCDHVLQPDEELLVQVKTDAIKTKDPVVSQFFELTEEHVCLIHGSGNHGVSKKLSSLDRETWKRFLQDYDASEYHLLLRTSVQTCSKDTVISEIDALQKAYENLIKRGKTGRVYSLLYAPELDYNKRFMAYTQRYADLMEQGELAFLTDDYGTYEKLRTAACESGAVDSMVQRYDDASYELYKLYSLPSQLEGLLSTRVWLDSGANLLVESMETLTAIDVNSAKSGGKKHKRDQVLAWNKEAAWEIARQLRLRNLSGMILIDFINMSDAADQEELLRYMRQLTRYDTKRVVVVDITPLGLMELTREKSDKTLAQTIKSC